VVVVTEEGSYGCADNSSGEAPASDSSQVLLKYATNVTQRVTANVTTSTFLIENNIEMAYITYGKTS